MRTTIKLIMFVVLGIIVITGCVVSSSDSQAAQQVLEKFFAALSSGNYAEAANNYGGSYDNLAAFNPDVDPSDVATLWQYGCQVNGLQCLPTRSISFVEESPERTFIFKVEFNTPDGSLFIRQPCCGEDVTNVSPTSSFEYHVTKAEDGKFRVQDLPVYVP